MLGACQQVRVDLDDVRIGDAEFDRGDDVRHVFLLDHDTDTERLRVACRAYVDERRVERLQIVVRELTRCAARRWIWQAVGIQQSQHRLGVPLFGFGDARKDLRTAILAGIHFGKEQVHVVGELLLLAHERQHVGHFARGRVCGHQGSGEPKQGQGRESH